MLIFSNYYLTAHYINLSYFIMDITKMEENILNTENLAANLEVQKSTDSITKRITFKKETLRNLVTIASREHFESKLKQDELLSITLDEIINSYYEQYWAKNKPSS